MDPVQLSPGVELRELRPDDADALYALIDAERDRLGERLTFVHATIGPEDTRAFIESCRAGENLDGNGIWVDGSIAGGIGMTINRYDSGEIGYWLGSAFEGRGLVTSACRALIDIAFNDRELHRVSIEVEPDNARSRAVPERLGFTLEAHLREAIKVGERYRDVVVYSLLDREWPIP